MRKIEDMTGLEVASRADIPVARIIGFRKGWIRPRPKERARLARVLRCQPDEVEAILRLQDDDDEDMSVLEMAVKADIPVARIIGFRRGWIRPRPKERARLARILGCQPDEVEAILRLPNADEPDD